MDTVRRTLEAAAAGDHRAVTAAFAREIEIDDQDIPDADGHDSYFAWMERWNESWEGWMIEDVELVPAGDDKVLALFRMVATGKGSGIELSRNDAMLAEFSGDKIARIGYYNDQAQARKAAGLSE